jgi:pyruvate/2-oxoacid:ferredoxin oxidoreductase alpha subunit/ferredoxin
MKYWNDILGKTTERTGTEAIRLLEDAVSEGFLSTSSLPEPAGKNIFGRRVIREIGSDLSFLAGLAVTGLRSSAFLSGSELTANYNQLADLLRRHLAAVVHYATQGEERLGSAPFSDFSRLHAVAGAGCFQFVASNLQEAIDLTLIAHKVAELALIPGICAMDGRTCGQPQEATIPSADVLRRFLGEPDTHIDPPTPAQKMIFGKERRRIPQWFSLDTPVMSGVRKDARSLDLEGAAQDRYFHHHLPEIIVEVMSDYADRTGRPRAPLNGYRTERADYLILTLGSAYEQAKPVIDQLRTQERMKIGCLNISVLRPFPGEALAASLNGVKALTVLEGFSGRENGDAPLFHEVKAAAQALGKRAPKILSARYGSLLSPEALTGAVRNMTQKNEQLERVFLDIDFTRTASSHPQHEILLQTIRRAYPDITAETIRGGQAIPRKEKDRLPGLPFAVRRYRDEGPPFTHLSRFYHHTACFYQRGITVELVADPFQALPVLPAATASFAKVAGDRSSLPVFQAQNCTGCGACFTYCPHSAIPPVAIGPEALIRSAMDIAARQGTPVTSLTPMVRNLAKVAGHIIKERQDETGRVDDFLPAAFDRLAEQMKLSGERLEKAREEVNILRHHIGAFPVAVTDSFFGQPEAIEKGTGELFSLAVDPYACTGCGLCVAVCEDEALAMHSSETDLAMQLEQNLGVWEQLPDTPSDTVRRLIRQENYDPFAATLLSRNFYLSTTGSSTSEAGAPAKTTMHLLTAVAESVVQPRLAEQASRIKKQIDDLSSNIHEHLSDALPREDFHLAMEEIRESKLPLDAVIRKLRTEEHPRMVDAPTLQRKIELLNDLKELYRTLQEGPTGGGRARYGLSLTAPEAVPWGEDYPFNVFTAPVIWHWDGAAPEQMRGLMLGLRRHLIDNIRLLRRAELEIEDKYRPELHDFEIGRLQWADLEDHEKQLLAPLLLVGDNRLLSTTHSSGLLELLTLELPVKVIILDNAADTSGAALARSNTALFAAMTLRHAQIVRGSLEAGQAMFDGLREGLHSLYPALFHLLAPDPRRHVDQKRPWTALPHLALHTRAFPFFRYDPDIASGYLASDISLDANPDPGRTWVSKTLRYLEEEEEKEITYTLTYADWLVTQQDWQAYFRPVEPEETTVPAAGYLSLSPKERAEKAPVVFTIDEEQHLKQYVAMPKVITATQDARRQWNSLREIAGALTPFPEKLRKQVEAELTIKYEQSMTELRAEYEEKLQTKEREMMEQVRGRLRDKLLALSRQGENRDLPD